MGEEAEKSIRQLIIDEIDSQFKTILLENNYQTDLGKNIFEWRDTPLQANELPGLIYRDPTEEREAGMGV